MLALILLLLLNDADVVFQALDRGDVAALRKFAPARLVEIIRAGRPVGAGKTGEFKLKIVDGFKRSTDLHVYVPKSYRASRPAGVVVVLHGLGGTGAMLKDVFRSFAEEENCIVAAPTAQPEPASARNEDWDPLSGAQVPHWWSYRPEGFVFTALAELKRTYAVDEGRVVLSGYSMGGFGTWNIGLRYPDRFAAIVPFAGGLSRHEYLNRRGDPRLRPLVENAFNLPAYAAHGRDDPIVPVDFDRKTRDQLKAFGYIFEYEEVPKAGHLLDVRESSELMKRVRAWLKPRRRDAHPKRVVHYAVGSYAALSYWVRIDELAAKNARVEAEAKPDNVIELKAERAKQVTVFLDEKLVDLAKPLKVVSGGKTIFEGRAAESVETVLESWKLREDRELVYRAKVTVTLD